MKLNYLSPLVESEALYPCVLMSGSDDFGFDLVDNEGTTFEDWTE